MKASNPPEIDRIKREILNEYFPKQPLNAYIRKQAEEALQGALEKAAEEINKNNIKMSVQYETMNNMEEQIVTAREVLKQCLRFVEKRDKHSSLIERINKLILTEKERQEQQQTT